ncbi:hypothetical protein SK128_007789 [Halocaridina rubra]|uniref:Uncharacterized protein n=1 Tax=Halocaridina rubra TaxID=373956 RepID=A0AAN9A313_HALRR
MTGDSSFLPQNVHLLSSRLIFTSCTVIEQETHNVGEIVNDLALQIQSQHISLDLEKIIRGSEEALLAIIRSSTDHSRKDRTSTGSKAIDKFRVRISNATTHFLAEVLV